MEVRIYRGTRQFGAPVEVGISVLVCQFKPGVLDQSQVRRQSGSVASVTSKLAKAAIDELLLAVVAEHAGEFLEAGLYSCNSGEGHAAPALKLILYLADQLLVLG